MVIRRDEAKVDTDEGMPDESATLRTADGAGTLNALADARHAARKRDTFSFIVAKRNEREHDDDDDDARTWSVRRTFSARSQKEMRSASLGDADESNQSCRYRYVETTLDLNANVHAQPSA